MGARYGHFNLCKLLLLKGADPNAEVHYISRFINVRKPKIGGNTIQYIQDDVEEEDVASSSNTTLPSTLPVSPTAPKKSMGKIINLLVQAVEANDYDLVEILLSKNKTNPTLSISDNIPDTDTQQKISDSTLYAGLQYAVVKQNLKMAQLLVESGGDAK